MIHGAAGKPGRGATLRSAQRVANLCRGEAERRGWQRSCQVVRDWSSELRGAAIGIPKGGQRGGSARRQRWVGESMPGAG